MELTLPYEFEYERSPEMPLAAIHPETGERFEFRAIVDTGADGTLLDAAIAEEIGIDLSSAATALVGGVGGVLGGAKSSEVIVEVIGAPELRSRLLVSFAPGVAGDFGNLLGMNFWASFDLAVVHSRRKVAIGRTDQP